MQFYYFWLCDAFLGHSNIDIRYCLPASNSISLSRLQCIHKMCHFTDTKKTTPTNTIGAVMKDTARIQLYFQTINCQLTVE